MNTIVKIYSIHHPVSKEMIYIGRTIDPLEVRLGHHVMSAVSYKRKAALQEWIRNIIAGLKYPEIRLIASYENDWEDKEDYWIGYYKNQGVNLLNVGKAGKTPWIYEPEKARVLVLDIVERLKKGHTQRSIEKELGLTQGWIKNLKRGNITIAKKLGIEIPDSLYKLGGTGKGWSLDKKSGKYKVLTVDSKKNRVYEKFNTQEEAEEFYSSLWSNPDSVHISKKRYIPEIKNEVSRQPIKVKINARNSYTNESMDFDSLTDACNHFGFRYKTIQRVIVERNGKYKGWVFQKEDIGIREIRKIKMRRINDNIEQEFDNYVLAAKFLKTQPNIVLDCLSGIRGTHKGYSFQFAE